MCVIVHVEAKKTVEKQLLQNCYDHNRDGWGIMWADGEKINHIKDTTSFDDFYKAWKDVPRHCERGIHFRIRTAGAVNKDNCHPFFPNEKLGLMHNGIISTPLIDKDMSDTHNFVKYELAPIIEGWEEFLTDENFHKLMEEMTGYSKLLMIDKDGSWCKTRAKMWHEDSGIFYSNAHSIAGRTSYAGNFTQKNSSHITRGVSVQDNKSTTQNSGSTVVSSGALNSTGVVIPPVYPNRRNSDWRKDGETSNVINDAETCSIDKIAEKVVNRSIVAELDADAQEGIKSDLYSAYTKSSEDRQKELDARLEEQIQDALALEEDEAYTRFVNGERVTPVVENVEDDEDDDSDPTLVYDIEQLVSMTYEDMLDAVKDYPKSIAYTLKGLVDTCVTAGIFKQPTTSEVVKA